MKSIKSKLIIYFTILIVLASSGVGLVSLRTSSNAVSDEVEKALILLAEEGSKLINSRMENDYVYLEGLAGREKLSNPEGDLETKMTFLLDEVRKTGEYLRIGVSDMEGNLYLSDSYGIRGAIVDVSEREYYHHSLGGNRGLLPPAISVNADDNGALIVVYSVPLTYEGNIVGVLVAVADANFLNTISNDMGFGDLGYAYIINGTGTVIAHPNTDRVLNQFNPIEEVKIDSSLKSLADSFTLMLQNKSGVSNYLSEGNKFSTGYAPIEGTDWILVITANEGEVLAAIPILQRNIIISTLIFLIISIILCYMLAKGIADPITNLSLIIERLSNYDLVFDENSKAIKYLDRKDEIGTITRALGNMQKNLVTLVKDISETSQQVASSSEELTATSQQSATAAEEVARTIEEIAKGATDQAKDTEKGVENITELGLLIEQDQQYINNLNTSTNEVTKLKDEGMEILKGLVKNTNINNQSAKEIQEIIVNTNESAVKIESASQMIKNIADQTNLLALNAAIEAARAGEAGRGFAVVAEEIRKLAEQSNLFTEEIAVIIKELTEKTGHAVKTMEAVGQNVAAQTESVEQTNTKFKGIDTALEKMKEIIIAINQSGKTMEGKKDEIISIIESLSAISQQNAAGTEEASASVEEQTASMEEIANASESLARLAEEMQESISKFKY